MPSHTTPERCYISHTTSERHCCQLCHPFLYRQGVYGLLCHLVRQHKDVDFPRCHLIRHHKYVCCLLCHLLRLLRLTLPTLLSAFPSDVTVFWISKSLNKNYLNFSGLQITHWAFITAVVLIGVLYVVFCLYLTVDMVKKQLYSFLDPNPSPV